MNQPVNIQEHFDLLQHLLDFERREEEERFHTNFLRRSPEERERRGLSLLRLVLTDFHFSAGGHHLITLCTQDGKRIEYYAPDVGDLVCLTSEPNTPSEGPIGTVYDRSDKEITLAFNRKLPFWVKEEGVYHLHVAGPGSSMQTLKETVGLVSNAKDSRAAHFRDLSFGLRKPVHGNEAYEPALLQFFNPDLNEFQKRAVAQALGSRDVFLIHGPPGTGKTTVLIEVIRQSLERGESIFATAPSNIACDHMTECLVRAGVPVIRFGHPARILKHLHAHTLDYQLAHHPLSSMVDDLDVELNRMKRQRSRKKSKGFIAPAEWSEIRNNIASLQQEMAQLEQNILTQVLQSGAVFIGTHLGTNDPLVAARTFDLMIMDEATQGIEPSSWVPVLKAEKIIMAGDPFQLPPTVLSKQAAEGGLSVSLFERFFNVFDERNICLLRTQYRMNETIMTFSSREFYEGKLNAHEQVKRHVLSGLADVQKNADTEQPFLFLDTAGRGFEEEAEPGTNSKLNRQEAQLLIGELERYSSFGVLPQDIAVISPYSAQVRLLRQLIPDREIEVDTVDGFQGREKELVLVSLVRSNLDGELGFLTDKRRMNVAMTRARRKLIVVGDSATLSSIDFYAHFMKYVDEVGAYRSSWENV